jgi:hypothetical protein
LSKAGAETKKKNELKTESRKKGIKKKADYRAPLYGPISRVGKDDNVANDWSMARWKEGGEQEITFHYQGHIPVLYLKEVDTFLPVFLAFLLLPG